jgi:hypothetical protein
MIYAPNTFDEFLKKLFIVNDASMAFWYGDMPVVYEDRVRRWNALINRYYLKQTNDLEAQEYFKSFQRFDLRGGSKILSVDKLIKIYNRHIRNSEFVCINIFGGLHFDFLIGDIVDQTLRFDVYIEIDKLIDYFKKHLLGRKEDEGSSLGRGDLLIL